MPVLPRPLWNGCLALLASTFVLFPLHETIPQNQSNPPNSSPALLMMRFYQNWLGQRPGLDRPLPKAEALREAKDWLRRLTLEEADAEDRKLPRSEGAGETQRSERSERPAAAAAGKEVPSAWPFAHPHYWAGFILIGDPN